MAPVQVLHAGHRCAAILRCNPGSADQGTPVPCPWALVACSAPRPADWPIHKGRNAILNARIRHQPAIAWLTMCEFQSRSSWLHLAIHTPRTPPKQTEPCHGSEWCSFQPSSSSSPPIPTNHQRRAGRRLSPPRSPRPASCTRISHPPAATNACASGHELGTGQCFPRAGER